jgi:hypothetical protein
LSTFDERPMMGSVKDQPRQLEHLRVSYLAALDQFDRCAQEMRAALDEASDASGAVRAHVEAGRPARDVTRRVAPDQLRTRLSAAAVELERARHQGQTLWFAMLVEEGLTKAEVGRAFGISRSLVSRMLNDLQA